MEFLCPSCQKPLQVPDQYAGTRMKCPLCQAMFTAPALPPASSSAAPGPAPFPPPPPHPPG
jgi:LSD1 subclass zinc finger protein